MRDTRAHRLLLALARCVCMCVCIVLAACSRQEAPAQRVVLLGVDGADWDVIDRLIEDGRLPNFARMKSEGTTGDLRSHEPIFSPVIWASISTGKGPKKHGVRSFVAPLELPGGKTAIVPVTSNMLTAARVWDILSRRDRTVGVVGWWTTWPATPVNGFLCSERTWPITLGPWGWPVTSDGKAPELGARTYPADLYDDVASHIVTRDTLSDDDRARVDVEGVLAMLGTGGPSAADTYARDLTFARIARELDDDESPDFMTLYLELPDVMSHHHWSMWRAHRAAAHGETDDLAGALGVAPETITRVGEAFEQSYAFVDSVLGAILDEAGPDTLVLVVSDHGYGENRGGRPLNIGAGRHAPVKHWHHLDGVILARGPGVPAGQVIEGARVVDVTPTVLYALGEPTGDDMDGVVLTGLFDQQVLDAHPAETVPTLEPDGLTLAERMAKAQHPIPSPDDEALREMLRSLGYLE